MKRNHVNPCIHCSDVCLKKKKMFSKCFDLVASVTRISFKSYLMCYLFVFMEFSTNIFVNWMYAIYVLKKQNRLSVDVM